jgi:hypothetical protein
MLFGVAGCCVMLCIEAAMVAEYAAEGTNKAGLGVGVAAFYVFLIIYSLGIDVCGVVFYSELFPNHIRAKGVALAMLSIALTDLVYLQATAEAFANIGWKFYLVSLSPRSRGCTNCEQVFICVTFLGVIWAYFAIPETKGIPLEELAAIFGDDDEIVVYMKDIHVDHNTHQLVVDIQKGTTELGRVVTELHSVCKPVAKHIEGSPVESNSEKGLNYDQ